jgi:hypothetical protein
MQLKPNQMSVLESMADYNLTCIGRLTATGQAGKADKLLSGVQDSSQPIQRLVYAIMLKQAKELN